MQESLLWNNWKAARAQLFLCVLIGMKEWDHKTCLVQLFMVLSFLLQNACLSFSRLLSFISKIGKMLEQVILPCKLLELKHPEGICLEETHTKKKITSSWCNFSPETEKWFLWIGYSRCSFLSHGEISPTWNYKIKDTNRVRGVTPVPYQRRKVQCMKFAELCAGTRSVQRFHYRPGWWHKEGT